ncbi:hydroxyacylglutathione hydrolase [Idiomarina tyrosinivorans]|uniref:Hydroxyacylglutathione hydrolase n=1 Tax=Idiomarina tyrosinivorans TaxID=1445662 RepID=A0A432ZLT9_9GAMM|nr:hydroxyacylglutathione hydrolase [Idiomarina tyrosinivorans]RUO78894.1 hydroxyacylglutathione hydrolase [Idiomarina tyrosinivorans]
MRVVPVPAFNDNYIWIVQAPQNSQVVVVDPGDHQPVMAWLQQHQCSIAEIWITHHHADHTGGVAELVEAYDCPVRGPKDACPDITHVQQDGDRFVSDLFNAPVQVLSCPGHTLDHIAYYSAPSLFCGDTLFSAGCGRMFEGTAEQFVTSLQKFRELPGETQVYCAHEYTQANVAFAQKVEPNNTFLQHFAQRVEQQRQQQQTTLPSTMAVEMTVNPFLRFDQPAVKQSAEQHSGRSLSSNAEVFAAIRQWKDNN